VLDTPQTASPSIAKVHASWAYFVFCCMFEVRRIGQEPRSGAERVGFCLRGVVKNQSCTVVQRSKTAPNLEGVHGREASQTVVGRKAEFSRVGVHRVRLGIQRFRAACWKLPRRNEAELRAPARQEVRIPRLCATPEGRKGSRLAECRASCPSTIAKGCEHGNHLCHSEKVRPRESRMA